MTITHVGYHLGFTTLSLCGVATGFYVKYWERERRPSASVHLSYSKRHRGRIQYCCVYIHPQMSKCRMIGKCERPAGAHGHEFSIKPVGKLTAVKSCEFSVLIQSPNCLRCSFNNFPFDLCSLTSTKSLKSNCPYVDWQLSKIHQLNYLKLMFPLEKKRYWSEDQS